MKNKKTEIKKKNEGGEVVVKKSDLKVLEKLTVKLFSLMGINSKAEFKIDKVNNSLTVDIQGEDETGLLIGARGTTLTAIQVLLGLMLRQQMGDWRRVVVNISDYRQKEEERLAGLAGQSAERALATGEPQYLYNLTPSQRRIVHMALAEEKGVITKSEGEGKDRCLIVAPK